MNPNSPKQNDFRNAYQSTAISPSQADVGIDMEFRLASPWKRIGAYILNSLIGLVAVIPMLLSLIPFLENKQGDNTAILTSLGMGIVASLILGLGLLAWQTIWMTQRGQSIGKRIVGIKVVDLNAQNPGFVGTVLLREVVYSLILLVAVIVLGVIFGIIMAIGGTLENIERYTSLFDLIGYLPTLVCTAMLFNKKNQRRTLQDYLAKTMVVKA